MAELTDEEITQRVIKSINDLKFAKSTIKKTVSQKSTISENQYTGISYPAIRVQDRQPWSGDFSHERPPHQKENLPLHCRA